MNLDLDALQRVAASQFWQLTAVVCVVGLLTWLFCRRRPHLAYVLWLVVLVKAVTPPVWSSPTGVFSWAEVRAARSDSMPTSEPSANGVSPVFEPPGATSVSPVSEAGVTGVSPVSEPGATDISPAHGTLGWGELLGLAWLFGAAALGGLLVGRWSYYSVLLRHNSVDTPDEILRLVDELSERLGVRRGVRVLVTTRPFGPAVCGVWRPMLILPQALAESESTEHMRRIIAHELIHVRRGDHLVGVLQLLTQIVWWFHPLVWWTNRRICIQREHCCDEQVVASLRCDPGTYAQSLLDMLKLRRQLRPALLPGVDAPEVTKKRLENLMDPRKVFHGRAPRVCWAVLIVGILLLVPGAGLTLAEKGPEPAGVTASANPDEAAVAKVVKSFLAAATRGRIDEAVEKLSRHRANERDEIREMGAILASQKVTFDRVEVRGDKAMVLTSKIWQSARREGHLLFELVKTDEKWLIHEIDFEKGADRVDAFAGEGGVATSQTIAAEGPANLLQNAGFEEGEELPVGWSKGAAVPGVEYRWDHRNGFKSKASLSLRKTANRYFPIAQWHQTVDHKGTAHSLKVDAQVKAKRAAKATIDVIFLDAQGQWISHEWAAYIGAKDENDRPANHNWKAYSGQVNIPEGTRKITIGLQIYGPGQVWFDDVRATYVETPAAEATAAASEELTGPQLMQIGWAYWMKGQFVQALPKFEQAVKRAPDNADAWNGLGWTYFHLGRRAEAEKAFQRTLKLLPDAGGSLNGLGQLYLLEKKYDQAEKYLLKAAPGAPAAWSGLARLYLLQGKYGEAEKWAQKIVDSNQGDATALENARLLLKAAKEKRLDDDLRALIEPPPSAGQP